MRVRTSARRSGRACRRFAVAGRHAYFDIHHTANDTLDKVDREQLDQNVAAWAALGVARGRQRGGFPRPGACGAAAPSATAA